MLGHQQFRESGREHGVWVRLIGGRCNTAVMAYENWRESRDDIQSQGQLARVMNCGGRKNKVEGGQLVAQRLQRVGGASITCIGNQATEDEPGRDNG